MIPSNYSQGLLGPCAFSHNLYIVKEDSKKALNRFTSFINPSNRLQSFPCKFGHWQKGCSWVCRGPMAFLLTFLPNLSDMSEQCQHTRSIPKHESKRFVRKFYSLDPLNCETHDTSGHPADSSFISSKAVINLKCINR